MAQRIGQGADTDLPCRYECLVTARPGCVMRGMQQTENEPDAVAVRYVTVWGFQKGVVVWSNSVGSNDEVGT